MSDNEEKKTRYQKASEGIGIAMRIVFGVTIATTVGLIIWALLKIFGANV